MRFSRLFIALVFAASALAASAQKQKQKVYDENIDPMTQIDSAVASAKEQGKNVICQVGGNWCRWCLMLADFITTDPDIADVIDKNYVYIHVNYPRGEASQQLMARLHNPGRFGYPTLVVLNPDGDVIHIQDSSYLEDGDGYDKAKVLRMLTLWSPPAL